MVMIPFLLAVAGLLAPPQAHEGNGGPVLGVVEQPQCTKDPSVAVRALFVKRGGEWKALTSEEESQGVSLPDVWTVGFDGKNLGTVSTFDPGFQSEYAWTFPRDRLLLLKAAQVVPNIANEKDRFHGWCDPPSRRPLVVVSNPAVRDPERWKPFHPGETLRARLFPPFKEHAGSASTCPDDPDTPKPHPYASSDLLFSPSFQDRSGRQLVVLGLDPRLNTCDGPSAEPAWATHSFILRDEVLYIGQNLSLVDAGDYDSDGASEFLFWYSGYNDDGYTLFYDGFRKHADYHWHYH